MGVEVRYSSDLPLGEDALRLVWFDVESLYRVIRARQEGDPDVWLARPEGYQADGHMLRDSETVRLVAWSESSSVLYATDGCNTCRHVLDKPLRDMSEQELKTLSERAQVPYLMLKRGTPF